MDNDLVWYVSYGSNLWSERFRCYLEGGTPPGSKHAEVGARDPSPPRDDRGVLLPFRLYFAGRSRRWDGGAPAYIDTVRDETVQTWARAWLITAEQFEDVVRQENGDPDLTVDLAAAKAAGHLDLRDRGYGRLLHLGDMEGHPMVTFTSPLAMAERRTASPSDSYLTVIAIGLRETFAVNAVGLRRYLKDAPGIDGDFSHGRAKKLNAAALEALGIDESVPDPDTN